MRVAQQPLTAGAVFLEPFEALALPFASRAALVAGRESMWAPLPLTLVWLVSRAVGAMMLRGYLGDEGVALQRETREIQGGPLGSKGDLLSKKSTEGQMV